MRHPVGNKADIPQGKAKLVQAGEEKVLIYHLSDGFFATQARCTHLFKTMEKGKILDDKCIQCPLHRARFDIRTGEVDAWASFPPGVQLLNAVRKEKALTTYPVEEEGDALFVLV